MAIVFVTKFNGAIDPKKAGKFKTLKAACRTALKCDQKED